MLSAVSANVLVWATKIEVWISHFFGTLKTASAMACYHGNSFKAKQLLENSEPSLTFYYCKKAWKFMTLKSTYVFKVDACQLS